jgi:hypothetical protein
MREKTMTQKRREANPSQGGKDLQPVNVSSSSLPKALRLGAGILAILVLVPFIASYFLDAPLRGYLETKMNGKLKGYSVHLAKAHFQLIGFSMTLSGLTVSQKAYPNPPIANFPVLQADVNWRALLHGRLVAEFRLERPEVNVNLLQLSHEAASAVPLKEQGWQQAVEVIYPLKINVLTIQDGSITYIDKDPKKPLRLSRLNLNAENIRNVRLPDKVYPSSFHLESDIFQTGRGAIDGNANFFAEPYPGIKARISLKKIPLDYFKSIVERSNLSIHNGLFSVSGDVEYAPHIKKVNVKELAIEGIAIDYIHSPRTAAAETRHAKQVGKAAREVSKSEMQLRVDQVRIHEGLLTYIDKDLKKPLRLSHLNLNAENISNVRLPDNIYPSSFHLETDIFQTGHGAIDGKANLRAEPYPGIKARIRLEKIPLDIPLDYFKTVIARSNLSIHNGLFSVSGDVEYAPHIKKVNVKELAIEGIAIDYVHSPRTAAAKTRRAEQVGNAAREASRSKMQLSLDQLKLTRCTLGLVNESARHPYRVFISDAGLVLSNLSNQLSQGAISKAELMGKFMGSGATKLTASMRPDKKGQDINLKVKIEDTRLTDMDDLLYAYGNFEATAGTFSIYSELHIQDDKISGYVKPFFKDMKVGDRPEDKDKTFSHKMHETMVSVAAKILERRPQKYVATKVDILGSLKNPHTSTWQIIVRLIGNAFFNAIPPGLEKEDSGPKRK